MGTAKALFNIIYLTVPLPMALAIGLYRKYKPPPYEAVCCFRKGIWLASIVFMGIKLMETS